MADYLPDSAPSTEGIRMMEEEFGGDVADTRAMIKDVDIQEALAFKKDIATIESVSEVMWLDDVLDIKTPVEMADMDTVEAYYLSLIHI